MERFARYFGAVWIVFVAVLVTFYVATRRTELENIGQVIRSTDPRWILLAGCFELFILMLMAKMYQSLFVSLGHQLPLYVILSAYLRGLAAAAIVPFGGPVAVIIFTRAVARRNVPINDAVYVSALASLSGFASFLIMMIPLLSLLYLTGDLPAIFVTATLVLAALFVVALAAMSVLLRWGGPPSWLSRHIPNYLRDFVRQARSHRLT
ncbi:MAG TPA: lysylphosphatidylglycerol synthase domain-containing protein, partial [Nitrolancea sp.]|nr:lysylphosphatidylglycerol synthase domain-containing protein [Nitrolancea sp.]